MKRIISILTVVFILLSGFAVIASAETIPSERQKPRLADEAGIIPDSAEAEILSLLDSISEKRKFDVAIVTVASTNGADPMDCADDYYDYNGFGFGQNRDGALLFISMEPRYIWISTCGKGVKILRDVDPLIDTFYDDIVANDFASACKTFAQETDSTIGSFKLRPIFLIPVALIIGFIISSIIVSGYKQKQLKTVKSNVKAASYAIANSLMLANSTNNLIYSNVSRAPIVQNTARTSGGGGVHVSSSGTSHGGGGRSF